MTRIAKQRGVVSCAAVRSPVVEPRDKLNKCARSNRPHRPQIESSFVLRLYRVQSMTRRSEEAREEVRSLSEDGRDRVAQVRQNREKHAMFLQLYCSSQIKNETSRIRALPNMYMYVPNTDRGAAECGL